MRKYVVLAAFILMMIPALAWAQEPCSPSYTGTQLCNALPSFGGRAVTDIPSFISAGLIWLASVIGTLALVMVLFSGAQMIFSGGDPQAVTRAKNSLTYAIYGLALVIFAYVIVSAIQYFVGYNGGDPGSAPGQFFVNPLSSNNLGTFVSGRITAFLSIIGTIAMGYIIYGGFRYITSGGNEDQAKKARATLQWSIIGLSCIILSYIIVTVVVNTITNSSR